MIGQTNIFDFIDDPRDAIRPKNECMRILVACEESQEVCKAFRARGHEAFSCDVQECSGGHPEWHIQGDVLKVINGCCEFVTSDTHTHTAQSVGHGNSVSTVYRFSGKRSEMVRRETERFPTAEVMRILHADGVGECGDGGCGESDRYHVELLEKAGSDNTAVRVRASHEEEYVLMVKEPSEVKAYKDSRAGDHVIHEERRKDCAVWEGD